ncbi:MAG: DNA gyrase subunit A [Candidatus Micrarchaeaceae archaeon]
MSKISVVRIEDEMQSSYIDYAMSVIIGRAIPDARDGLKPVQRRILYGMYKLNNLHNLPTKKSARVVGEILGKYHPHGDAAVYASLVRMAQDFSINHPLVEGQGNMGSIDDDPPAAMRYTEVRLTKFAEELLDDIEKNVVEFVPNFDNTETEPRLLPAKAPNLLINGASGIAVGVATSIPPHNLSEVCDAVIYKIENQDATADDILKIIKGPDFPTGGIAVMSQSAILGYKFGNGRITVKAKADINEKENTIIVSEIPYNTSKAEIISEIADLAKGKIITGIANIRDESDKSGIRVAIDLRKDANPKSVLNALYAHTKMKVTLPIINLAVVDNVLKNFNILSMLSTFIDYRRSIIKKRTEFDLAQAKERDHIIKGLLTALRNIEEVIKIIKESRDAQSARSSLIARYGITEKQANAILDIKLSRLTTMEAESLEKEQADLAERMSYYNSLLQDPAKIDEVIKKETAEIKAKYGRPRRTEIELSDSTEELTDEDFIPDVETAVIFTREGYIKRTDPKNFREQSRGGKGVIATDLKEEDLANQILVCSTKETLLCISNAGNAYWLKVYRIPEANRYSKGSAIVNLLNLKEGETIVKLSAVKDFHNSKLLFLTKKGLVKVTNGDLFSKPRSVGVRAIKLGGGDALVDMLIYPKEGKYSVLIATENGKAIRFDENSIRPTGRASMGVRGIRLANDVAKSAIVTQESGYLLTITENGYGKLTEISRYRLQGRGGHGVINIKVNEKTGKVVKAIKASAEEGIIMINSEGMAINFPASSIRITGRAASGVRLMRLDGGAKVVDAFVVPAESAKPQQA